MTHDEQIPHAQASETRLNSDVLSKKDDVHSRLARVTTERNNLREERDRYRVECLGSFSPEICPDPIDFFPRTAASEGTNILTRLPLELFQPPFLIPLNVSIDSGVSGSPHVNVVLPSTSIHHTSGGPNTIFMLCAFLADRGIPLRLLSVTAPADTDSSLIHTHISNISGVGLERIRKMEIVNAFDRSVSISLGENDLFVATAWWTAQMIKFILPKFLRRRFVYIIQDYEPNLHTTSALSSLAIETYSLDYLPIVNSRLLHDFFVSAGVGNFSDSEYARRASYFEPAVDRSAYYFDAHAHTGKRRLLVYARPNAPRNLFEFAIVALSTLVDERVLDPEVWDLYATETGVSGACRPIRFDRRGKTMLLPLALHRTSSWAAAMRKTDVLLSLILSPHTSYPPLEGAACGAMVATNTYGVKTQERLREISSNIIAGPPTFEGVTDTLREAVRRSDDFEARAAESHLDLPETWAEAFNPIMPGLLQFISDNGIKAMNEG